MKRCPPFIIIFLLLIPRTIFADIVYLKSGGEIKGIIERETDYTVNIVVSIGSVTYSRAEIESISKSSDEENAKLKEKWKAEKGQKESKEEEWRKFAAEQEAKGLIFHKGQWITKDEYEKLSKPKLEEKKEVVLEEKPKPKQEETKEKPKEKPKEEKPVKPVDVVRFYDEVYRYWYRYAVRLPANYNTGTKYPVLFMFDPVANGDDAARRFAYAADKLGWIVVGSLDSKNGPWAPIERAQEAMLRDVPKRFSVDEKQFYAGGLSGGARAAFAFAYRHSTQFKGVIACAAGLSGGAKKSSIPNNVAVYFCIGKKDMNFDEVKGDYGKIRITGAEVYVHEFEGGHEWPPQPVIKEALNWMVNKTQSKK